MYDIGILGGMGPKATGVLFQQIIDNTCAHTDQEHLRVAVVSVPQIPDRSAYLLGKSAESPLLMLAEGIRDLDALGAKIILIPCNTSHYFYPQLAENCRGYILNMVSNALQYVAEGSMSKRVCILGTKGTVQSKIYDRYNQYDLSICYPTVEECEDIHRIIYAVKGCSTSLPVLAQELDMIINQIRDREGNVTIAVACTELSVLYPLLSSKTDVVEVMLLMALTAIRMAGTACMCTDLYDMDVIDRIIRGKQEW